MLVPQLDPSGLLDLGRLPPEQLGRALEPLPRGQLLKLAQHVQQQRLLGLGLHLEIQAFGRPLEPVDVLVLVGLLLTHPLGLGLLLAPLDDGVGHAQRTGHPDQPLRRDVAREDLAVLAVDPTDLTQQLAVLRPTLAVPLQLLGQGLLLLQLALQHAPLLEALQAHPVVLERVLQPGLQPGVLALGVGAGLLPPVDHPHQPLQQLQRTGDLLFDVEARGV